MRSGAAIPARVTRKGMFLPASDLRPRDAYALLTSALVPRPIAWVGSRSAAGVDNLAPFSYFMGVGSDPPALAVSVARLRGGARKDTAANITETGVFSVSMVSATFGAAMVETSLGHAPEVDEFAVAGVPKAGCVAVEAPRPASSAVCFECRLLAAVPVGTVELFIGQIIGFHLDPAVLVPGASPPLVDPLRLDPLARLGGVDYARLGPLLSLPPRAGGPTR